MAISVSTANLLDVPSSYGVKVQDAMGGTQLDQTDNELAHAPAGLLLVAKICDALVTWGYDDDDVRKVGGLVAKNLLTCESAHERAMTTARAEDDESVGQTIHLMLKSVLDKSVLRSRTVHVNSNEPVVLVNTPAKMDWAAFCGMVDETVAQLQHDWNIWPVRVYAGPFVPESGDEDFSITLLNVVNTDIGGPSMVQLLDAPCEAPEWTAFNRREVWRERELLNREEKSTSVVEGSFEQQGDNASERSLESDHESVDSEPLMDIDTSGSARQVDEAAADDVPPLPQREHVAPEPLTDEKEQAQSAVDPSSEDDIPRQEMHSPDRHIDHPTWERPQDTMSLLDLIRSQASILVPFGQDSAPEGKVDEAGEDAAEAKPTKATSSSEEEFVVV